MLLASGSDDRTIVVWDVATATQREQLAGHLGSVRSLAFGPDDAALYSLSFDLGLLMWDLRGDRRFIPRSASAEPENLFSDFAIPAPDGEVVAYFGRTAPGDWGSGLRFRDVGARRLGEPILTGHANWGQTWRPPDWEQFATTDDDGFVHVWDWRRGELVAERQVAAGIIHTISYTPDGQRIVIAEPSGAVSQVDADTLEAVGPTVKLAGAAGELAISLDQRRAVAMVPGATLAVIDLVDGRVVSEVDLGFDATWPEISPDGNRLAIGSTSGEVGLVDIESGGWIRAPTIGHSGFVLRIAYAPDGATFASSGHDGRVSLWDGRTGDLLVSVLPGRPEDWATVEYLPDGHTVVVATRAGAVYTWDTRLEHWIDFACAVAGRNLTADEWRDVFGDRGYRDTCPPVTD